MESAIELDIILLLLLLRYAAGPILVLYLQL